MGDGESVLNEYKFPFRDAIKALELRHGDGCTTSWVYLMPLNFMF